MSEHKKDLPRFQPVLHLGWRLNYERERLVPVDPINVSEDNPSECVFTFQDALAIEEAIRKYKQAKGELAGEVEEDEPPTERPRGRKGQ